MRYVIYQQMNIFGEGLQEILSFLRERNVMLENRRKDLM